MGLPATTSGSLAMSQSQAQWDAIAAIKTTSPFATDSDSGSGSGVGNALDAILTGYTAQTDAIASQEGYATAGSGASAGGQADDETLAQVTARVRAAQQSTIDLFA